MNIYIVIAYQNLKEARFPLLIPIKNKVINLINHQKNK